MSLVSLLSKGGINQDSLVQTGVKVLVGAGLNTFIAPMVAQKTASNSTTSTNTTSNYRSLMDASKAKNLMGNDSNSFATSHKIKLVEKMPKKFFDQAVNQTISNIDTYYGDYAIVEFDNMPTVQEVRNVGYEKIAPPHMPGQFQKFQSTESTEWTITAKLTCCNRQEALRMFSIINTLRVWTLPFFGNRILSPANFTDTKSAIYMSNKLGAPPPVLQFYGLRGVIGPVPVVIRNVSWTWPNEVDWIPAGDIFGINLETPMPTVMDVNIGLVESFSANDFNSIDLVALRNGDYRGGFSGITNYRTPEISEPTFSPNLPPPK